MLLWHVGGAIFLFRWIFRDPKVDLRILALGAAIPDLIDFAFGLVLGGITTRRVGHSLLFPSLLGIGLLLLTRRGRRRRNLMTLVVAWLFHLLLDAAWLDQRVFLWPFFGWELADPVAGSIWERAQEPWRWVKEILGATYLYLLFRRPVLRPNLDNG